MEPLYNGEQGVRILERFDSHQHACQFLLLANIEIVLLPDFAEASYIELDFIYIVHKNTYFSKYSAADPGCALLGVKVTVNPVFS